MNSINKAFAAVALALAASAPVQAADRINMIKVEDAMAANGARERLGDSVKFYFGSSATPKVAERRGPVKTSRKTNSFGKSPSESCNWVFLSAMLELKQAAEKAGANAVINIESNYNNVPRSSTTEIECHDGAIMSGIALKGEMVRLAK
jgi:hypothetical protein